MRVRWFLVVIAGFAGLAATPGYAQFHPPTTVRSVAKPAPPSPVFRGLSVGGPTTKGRGIGGAPSKSGGVNGTVKPKA
jgi:hypothetical protein